MAITLLEPKKRIDIRDLQLPWRPLYNILERELFPKQRKTGLTTISASLLNLAEFCQRFFPPHEASAMLATFLPRLNGSKLGSILATQSFLVHFLPLSHPQDWLPIVFNLWSSFNSQIWNDQWLDLLARLSEKHMDPILSDPLASDELKRINLKGSGNVSNGMEVDLDISRPVSPMGDWQGIRKDVGIFTDVQWSQIMTKCLRAMGRFFAGRYIQEQVFDTNYQRRSPCGFSQGTLLAQTNVYVKPINLP